jgi:four helix bundle protein
MSNIAEGFERRGDIEFSRYLMIAKASAGEVRSQLYVALDLEYIDQQTFAQVSGLAEAASRMTAGLINYLKGKTRVGVNS